MTELLKVPEACKRLEISARTLRRMIASGEFPQPVRRNRKWVRIPAHDIDKYFEKLLKDRGK
jgi:excisionase family DNA binding protein